MEERNLTIEQAANVIRNANVLLVATGAGFSADSGLPVYGDIANQPVYKQKGLTYKDICSTTTLQSNPDEFYGFFGHTANMYRDTEPHFGYDILLKWRNDILNNEKNKEFTSLFHDTLKEKLNTIVPEYSSKLQEDIMNSIPGPFFSYTSNVDGHFRKKGFKESEIEEMHGCIDFWQCSDPESCNSNDSWWWWLPNEYRFEIDTNTMEAPNIKSSYIHKNILPESDNPTGFHRDNEENFGLKSFIMNHPICIHCGNQARPNIVMFNDDRFVDGIHTSHYLEWEQSVNDLQDNANIVILEIGCGMSVPSIRVHTEQLLRDWKSSSLIRINPIDTELNFIDKTSENIDRFIPITGNGLECLNEINNKLF